MAALITASRDPNFPAEVAVVISNVPSAYGLQIAEREGVATQVVNHKDYPSRETFDAAITGALEERGVEIVCNAGFMRLHSAGFVDRWRGRQINIHPSLLPSFPGLHPQRQALRAGVRVTGCTVHFVTEDMDAGPIIAQASVPVEDGDTEDTLSARILTAEHRLYPHALALVATGHVAMEGVLAVSRGEVQRYQPWSMLQSHKRDLD